MSVGYWIYCITEQEGNLCRVRDVLQNSQKCRVLWHDRHRTHKSVKSIVCRTGG